jgi:hypothetical protein
MYLCLMSISYDGLITVIYIHRQNAKIRVDSPRGLEAPTVLNYMRFSLAPSKCFARTSFATEWWLPPTGEAPEAPSRNF